MVSEIAKRWHSTIIHEEKTQTSILSNRVNNNIHFEIIRSECEKVNRLWRFIQLNAFGEDILNCTETKKIEKIVEDAKDVLATTRISLMNLDSASIDLVITKLSDIDMISQYSPIEYFLDLNEVNQGSTAEIQLPNWFEESLYDSVRESVCFGYQSLINSRKHKLINAKVDWLSNNQLIQINEINKM